LDFLKLLNFSFFEKRKKPSKSEKSLGQGGYGPLSAGIINWCESISN
jgi:hypothetical protein